MTVRWRQFSPATEPHVWEHFVTLDESTGDVIMVGWSPSTNDIETWKWDGVDWTQIISSPNPTPTAGFLLFPTSLAWDGVNGRVMLACKQRKIVGITPITNRFFYLDSGPTWTPLVPATTTPTETTPSVFGGKMFWDPSVNLVGYITAQDARLWTWDGSDFTDTGQTLGIGQFTNMNWSWYPPLSEVIGYGGNPDGVTNFTTTYSIDSALTAYTTEAPANNPGARGTSRSDRDWMAYLRCARSLAVLGDSNSNNDHTWLYHDVGAGTYDWEDLGALSPTPDAGSMSPAMCTDRSGNVLLLLGSLPYGASMETWILSCRRHPQVMRWH